MDLLQSRALIIFLVIVALLFLALFGYLGRYIAKEKNRSQIEGFLLGSLLGAIGILVIAILPNNSVNNQEDNLPDWLPYTVLSFMSLLLIVPLFFIDGSIAARLIVAILAGNIGRYVAKEKNKSQELGFILSWLVGFIFGLLGGVLAIIIIAFFTTKVFTDENDNLHT